MGVIRPASSPLIGGGPGRGLPSPTLGDGNGGSKGPNKKGDHFRDRPGISSTTDRHSRFPDRFTRRRPADPPQLSSLGNEYHFGIGLFQCLDQSLPDLINHCWRQHLLPFWLFTFVHRRTPPKKLCPSPNPQLHHTFYQFFPTWSSQAVSPPVLFVA